MIEIVIDRCTTCDDCDETIRLDLDDITDIDGALLCTGCYINRLEVRAEAAEQQLAEQRVAMLAKAGSLADECHLLREMLHEMEEMRDTGVRQRDEERVTRQTWEDICKMKHGLLEEAETQLAEAQKSNAHWHVRVTALLNDREAHDAKLEEAQKELESWMEHHEMQEAEWQGRIAELERLVPDAALLETAAMFSRERSAIHLPEKLMQHAAAIRKYREANDGQS